MKNAFIIAVAYLSLDLDGALADIEALPVPWVATSAQGDYLFKMLPAKRRKDGNQRIVDREALGVAYSISDDGEFEEIWRTNGWYAFEGYLSDDGRHFVRIGPWASDQEEYTDLAIAFYKDGELLKSHEVRELIRQPEQLVMSASHYIWRPSEQSMPNGFCEGGFRLVMIDKTVYTFDYETGEVAGCTRDEQAKSLEAVWQEEQEVAATKGRDLLETSVMADELGRHFKIEDVELSRGSIYGCSLEEPIWSATLVPMRRYAFSVSVSVLREVRDDRIVNFSLRASQISAALDKAVAHPFVQSRFTSGGMTGLRLRMQGDRLHWDTMELIEFIEKVTGERQDEDSLGHWANLIIDAKEPRYTSIYVDTLTGDAIAEDELASPARPYVVDAEGVRRDSLESGNAKPSGALEALEHE